MWYSFLSRSCPTNVGLSELNVIAYKFCVVPCTQTSPCLRLPYIHRNMHACIEQCHVHRNLPAKNYCMYTVSM